MGQGYKAIYGDLAQQNMQSTIGEARNNLQSVRSEIEGQGDAMRQSLQQQFEGEVAKQYKEAFKEVKNNPFMTLLGANDEVVDEVIDNIEYYVVRVNDEDLNEYLYQYGVDFKGVTQSTTVVILYNILSFVLPVLLIWGILGLVMRKMGGGMGGLGVGKSNAKIYVEKEMMPISTYVMIKNQT